ncbi:hypothetical protein [Pseudomonas xanthosomatis]|uniref:hypothetical protein n=1 Tax=Pseudomonas xanthosomatis TaxID=2842356 RepID=UPI003462A010
MDDDKAAVAADTLELLMMNQTAIRAALEELSLWICQRGSTHIHSNVLTALQTLDTNAQSIVPRDCPSPFRTELREGYRHTEAAYGRLFHVRDIQEMISMVLEIERERQKHRASRHDQ